MLGVMDWRLYALIWLMPLAAFIIHVCIGKKLPRRGDWLSIIAILLGLVLSLSAFVEVMKDKDKLKGISAVKPKISAQNESEKKEEDVFNPKIEWLNISGKSIFLGFWIDNITILMLVIVSIVSCLVHIYSMGYMHGDKRYGRFFAFLSLFTFSMFGLVISDNLLLLYVFWELVGLSSYLLIGFWFEKESAANACKKAFITTRVGDFFMFIGLMMIYLKVGSFSYGDIFAKAPEVDRWYMTVATILLFGGAVGKSAQFPLHTWLPDAMEGPTPVSALIHAATMVAAGVYMVTRLFPIFTPDSLTFVAYVGGFTALFAGTIGVAQNDIKRVLAYSTVSQLGYMIMSLGVGGYTAGFFHLWTHAYFKALLFLCSGSVIIGLHHVQDMRQMGGLYKKLPITFITMLIGTLAITGVPFFSGFYSKDAILGAVLEFVKQRPEHYPIAIFAFGGVLFTSFYMFRLIYLTFAGQPRDHHVYEHASEKTTEMRIMSFALVVLAVLSIIAGYGHWFQELVPEKSELVFGKSMLTEEDVHNLHSYAMYLSLGLSFLGILIASVVYLFRYLDAEKIAKKAGILYQMVLNKYWFDEFYDAVIVKPILKLCGFFYKVIDLRIIDGIIDGSAAFTFRFGDYIGWFDLKYIDGAVNETAETVKEGGRIASGLQTGKIKTYFGWLAGGLILIFASLWISNNLDEVVRLKDELSNQILKLFGRFE